MKKTLILKSYCLTQIKEKRGSWACTWSSLLRWMQPVDLSRSPPKIDPLFWSSSHSRAVLILYTNSFPSPSFAAILLPTNCSHICFFFFTRHYYAQRLRSFQTLIQSPSTSIKMGQMEMAGYLKKKWLYTCLKNNKIYNCPIIF